MKKRAPAVQPCIQSLGGYSLTHDKITPQAGESLRSLSIGSPQLWVNAAELQSANPMGLNLGTRDTTLTGICFMIPR